MKEFTKKIGKNRTRFNSIVIKATTWDGKNTVNILTSKNPTKKEKEETIEFLLGELDDHDAHDEYLKQIKKKEVKKKWMKKKKNW